MKNSFDYIAVGKCFVDAGIVYRCVENKPFVGCSKCAFLCVPDEGGVCVCPSSIRCHNALRPDGLDVMFEEIGELYELK